MSYIDLKKIKDYLEEEVKWSTGSDNDAKSWGMEEGIVISVNEANIFLNLVKNEIIKNQ